MREKPTILVVDDNKIIEQFIPRALRKQYECLTASDGEGGLDLYNANKSDIALVITNIDELIRALKADNPDLIIIA